MLLLVRPSLALQQVKLGMFSCSHVKFDTGMVVYPSEHFVIIGVVDFYYLCLRFDVCCRSLANNLAAIQLVCFNPLSLVKGSTI